MALDVQVDEEAGVEPLLRLFRRERPLLGAFAPTSEDAREVFQGAAGRLARATSACLHEQLAALEAQRRAQPKIRTLQAARDAIAEALR